MNDKEVTTVLSEWESRIAQIKLFDTPERLTFGNVNIAVDRFRSLASFLQYYVPKLREWKDNYLKAHRKEIFVTFCGTALHAQLFDPKQDSITTERADWEAIFGNTPISYAIAEEIAIAIDKKRPITACDDPTILEIHQGKECDTESWLGCYLCETQHIQWNRFLTIQLKDSDHPLRNPRYLPQVIQQYDTELENCEGWAPPRPTHKGIEEKCRNRERKKGLTVFQQMQDLLHRVLYLWKPMGSNKTMHDRFFQVWDTIDRIPHVIQLTLPDIIELEYTS